MPSRLKYIKIKRNLNRKKYFKAIKYPPIPLSQNDLYVITTVGDRVDLLSNQFYNDVDLWWIITTANPDTIRRDSFNLKAGLEVRIPTDLQTILEDFEQLN